METVVDLGCSISVPTQLIEKAAESIHSALVEVGEALELMAQALEGFVAALLKPGREVMLCGNGASP